MKKLFLLPLLILPFLLSCNGSRKNANSNEPRNIYEDFSALEKLDFKHFNNYEIVTNTVVKCMVEDTLLWVISLNPMNNFGTCLNLNTGEEYSTIMNMGRASNEFLDFYNAFLTRDSIHVISGDNQVKTFAKKDVVERIPLGERYFSHITPPKSKYVQYISPAADGSYIGTLANNKTSHTISSGFAISASPFPHNDDFTSESLFLLNKDSVISYESIDYDSFGFDISESDRKKACLKHAYANSSYDLHSDGRAVFALKKIPVIYIYDFESKKVVAEKRYGNFNIENDYLCNDMAISSTSIKCTDKYIYCSFNAYLSDEDIKTETKKGVLLVYDWDLNPVKMFEVPELEFYNNCYISEDGTAAYYMKEVEEGFELQKAELDI